MLDKKLCFIGGGNMGEALIAGLTPLSALIFFTRARCRSSRPRIVPMY